MATQKQIDANRRNAQKSTGPTTPEGKAAVAMNALKTGIHAKSAIIKGELAEDLETLTREYYLQHRPDTPELRDLVDDLISCVWELRRLTRAEAQMWNYQMSDSWSKTDYPVGKAVVCNAKAQAALQRRIDSTRRGRDRALKLIREHRDNPIAVPEPAPAPAVTDATPATSTPIGFVPSPPSEAPPAPPSQAALSRSALLQGRIKNCLTTS